MAFDGSGNYVLPATTVTPAVADTIISPTEFNTFTADLATALSLCLTEDGQNVATANLPMATFHHTGVGDATALTDYASANQVVDNTLAYGGASAVGTDDYAVNLPISPGVYVAGNRYQFIADVANTGACTINFSSLGAKSIKMQDGNDPATNYIIANSIVDVEYDGTNMILMNVPSVGVNTTSAQTLTNKTLTTPTLTTPILTTPAISSATFSGTQTGFRADQVQIDGVVTTDRVVSIKTSNVIRWACGGDTAAEPGSDVGTDFKVYRYSDAGAFLGAPFSIKRSNGLVTVANDLTVSNNFTVSGTTVTLPAGSIVDAALSATVTAAGTTWVQNRIAGAIIGAVGTYAYLGENTLTTTVAGGLQSGANLRFAGVNSTGSYTLAAPGGIASAGAGGTPSGTWRCMGYAYSAGGTAYPATMWLRIL